MIQVNDEFHEQIEEIKRNYVKGASLKRFLREYLPNVDAKKALGVLHGVIVDQEEPDKLVIDIFGSPLTRKEAIAVAHHFISQEEIMGSRYGDATVIESLNYFLLPNGDKIREFYKTL